MSNYKSKFAEFKVLESTDLLIEMFTAQLKNPFTELNKISSTSKSYRFAQKSAFWPSIERPRACNTPYGAT